MNLTKLQNITSLEFNNSLVNNSAEIGSNIISNANTTTQGYFGLVFMLTVFIFLCIILFADQDVFRFDMVKSILVASGIVTIIGIIAIITGIFNNFAHVMWFATIFMLMLIVNYFTNKGG